MRLIVCLIPIYGCVLSPASKVRQLPTVWDKNYGTIDYVHPITGDKSKITKYWAQEAIGAPEARQFLQDLQKKGIKLRKTQVGIIDLGFNQDTINDSSLTRRAKKQLCSTDKCFINDNFSHGEQVANLINSDQPVGVSSQSKISKIFHSTDKSVYQKINLPPIVNYSLSSGGTDYQKIKGDFKKFVERTIVVNASGNSFPAPVFKQVSENADKTVVVGSVDPEGFVSGFSQGHQELVVLAPSDYYVQSRGIDGKISSFSGTSGATPQVTATLADVKSILPQLTRDEGVTLLQKTATATAINEVSVLNGTGTLNQYRALRVAKRLKDQGFPKNRQMLIDEASIYDFRREALQLADEAKQHLLKEQDQLAFKKLRQAFLLDPENTQLRVSLADLYRAYGFSTQASFYDAPTKSIATHSNKMKTQLRKLKTLDQNLRKLYLQFDPPEMRNLTKKQQIKQLDWIGEELGRYFVNGKFSPEDLQTIELGNNVKTTISLAIDLADIRASQGGGIVPLKHFLNIAKNITPKLLQRPETDRIINKHSIQLGSDFVQALKNNTLRLIKLLL